VQFRRNRLDRSFEQRLQRSLPQLIAKPPFLPPVPQVKDRQAASWAAKCLPEQRPWREGRLAQPSITGPGRQPTAGVPGSAGEGSEWFLAEAETLSTHLRDRRRKITLTTTTLITVKDNPLDQFKPMNRAVSPSTWISLVAFGLPWRVIELCRARGPTRGASPAHQAADASLPRSLSRC